MGLLRWMRGNRTTSVRAVSMGMEMFHAVFNGNKATEIVERDARRRIGTPSRLSPGDPDDNPDLDDDGQGPLHLPDDWKRTPDR
jgi:hypothetical protein